ncbi:MAG TPA: IclR family transcriptional regulator [Solirubrobacteraceae bacterium]
MADEVGSVGRALSILEALPGGRDGIRASELARAVGVNPSTASRLLATLAAHRMAERTPQGTWRLGLGLLELSDRVLSGLDVRERARPWLRWLVEETGETATLSLPGAGEAITIDFVPSPRSVVSMARVGRPSAPHATATGKVMLLFGAGGAQDPLQVAKDLGRLERFTERTVCDPEALAEELRLTGRRGVAAAVGEREPDLAALAAPVRGRLGELSAIVGLQGPVARLPAARRGELEPILLRAAAEIAAALGA